MISENKLKHSLEVAKKCKKIATLFVPIYETNNYFMMGYLHDIGYETEPAENHSVRGYLACLNFGIPDNNFIQAIKLHGSYVSFEEMTLEYAILVYSDLTVSHLGESIPIDERIESIKTRYGQDSTQYLTAIHQKDELTKYFKLLSFKKPALKEKINELIVL